MSLKHFIFLLAVAATSFAAITRRVTCPDGKNTASNAVCCRWFGVKDDLQSNLFANQCGQEVREAIRLTFHDGLGFSRSNGGGGGADGSIIAFADVELKYAANNGNSVEDIVDALTPFVSKYNISPGDLIFFAAAIGMSNCPGSPRLEFYTGRPNPVVAAPDGMISHPTDTADTILARFADAGFSADELVALLASHSLAAADSLNSGPIGYPLDSTPKLFDSQFFVETSLKTPVSGVVRVPSDGLLARDGRTSCIWQNFIEDQAHMRSAFAAAMKKLSFLGQPPSLVDCTEVIPKPLAAPSGHGAVPYFPGNSTKNDVDAMCPGKPFPNLPQKPSVTSSSSVKEH